MSLLSVNPAGGVADSETNKNAYKCYKQGGCLLNVPNMSIIINEVEYFYFKPDINWGGADIGFESGAPIRDGQGVEERRGLKALKEEPVRFLLPYCIIKKA